MGVQKSAEVVVASRIPARREGPNRRVTDQPKPSERVVAQKQRTLWELGLGEAGGRNPLGASSPRQAAPAGADPLILGGPTLEEVIDRDNLRDAWKQVKKNKGAPGVDGMTINQAFDWLRENISYVEEQLLAETYRPAPVRRVDIPKPGGGTRMLGVPTVIDRMLQQAVAQVLTPLFDPTFSESSYGFRPGRSAHQAVRAAKQFIAEGHRWVVDVDLSKFFDRVNHDILMERVSRRVHDKRLLRLIRRWLQAGMMDACGLVHDRSEGTPQGGPLSPLLANILLDELDKKLGAAGHRFCRYADDCNVYVRSRRAGERVMMWMTRFLEGTLRLQINEAKSAVDRPWNRTFLGFSFTSSSETPKIRLAAKSEKRFRERVRVITKRKRGVAISRVIEELNRLINGWLGYFRLAETPSTFERLEKWIRRRLRCFILKQWKRASRIYSELTRLGAREAGAIAASRKGPWRLSGTAVLHTALTVAHFQALGLARLVRPNLTA